MSAAMGASDAMNPRDATPGATIRITLVCFSHVRDALGEASVRLELPRGSTAGDVERHVRALAPEKLGALPLRLAVNQELVERDAPLHDGDEVALLPPVQGG